MITTIDSVDPLYWKDNKYPKEIYTTYYKKVPWGDKNLKSPTLPKVKVQEGVYKINYQFLIPIPFKCVVLELIFRKAWKENEKSWCKFYKYIKQRVKEEGIKKLAEEIKDISKGKHLGWQWYYLCISISCLADKFQKLNFGLDEFKERFTFTKYIKNKNDDRVRLAFKNLPSKEYVGICKIFSPYLKKDILENFPSILLPDKNFLDIEEPRLLDIRLALSYELGLLPQMEAWINEPIIFERRK